MKHALFFFLLSFALHLACGKRQPSQGPELTSGDTAPSGTTEPDCGSSKSFAGGEGTEDSPFLIRSLDHFHCLTDKRHSAAHVIIGENLDLKRAGFRSINRFAGVLDGNGKILSNWTSSHSLITDLSGTIKDLNVVDAQIKSAPSRAGILAGTSSGKIHRCQVTGTIEGHTQLGGLAGVNWGEISDSKAQVDVNGTAIVGGLVGANSNKGVIRNSSAGGNVVALTNAVGGLVGSSDHLTLIANSYSTAAVNGLNRVGGLVGELSSQGVIENSYAVGPVAGSKSGGLVGETTSGTVTRSYWDTETSKTSSSAGGEGKTTAQMQDQATYDGWDFSDVWSFTPNQYPSLRSNR